MNHDLLGYVLGALEADELERIGSLLDAEPRFRSRVELFRSGLAPLESDRGHLEAPDGLARRTCQVVTIHIESTRIFPPDD
jgi:anti-sigma-K factor RskA